MSNILPKLIVILGPTASGKTKLAVDLATRYNGEIVSCDSRQVYRGMDIGTGKDLGEYKNVPCHMIDIVSPKTEYNVAKYKKKAEKIINNIVSRGKLPFLVGGTGLWISSIVDNYDIPAVKPNSDTRQTISKMSQKEKISILKKKDPDCLKTIDINNPRRLDRAVEVVLSGSCFSKSKTKKFPVFDCLQIGVKINKDDLDKKISKRVDEMIESGLVNEVKELLRKYGKKSASLQTIGYSEIIDHLDSKTSVEQATELIKVHTRQYAKRQMTWFKRDSRIRWVNRIPYQEIEKFIN